MRNHCYPMRCTTVSTQLELSLLLQEEEQRSAEASTLSSSHSSCFVAPEKKERLKNDDILRYSRQLILPEIGVKGKSFEIKWACLTFVCTCTCKVKVPRETY